MFLFTEYNPSGITRDSRILFPSKEKRNVVTTIKPARILAAPLNYSLFPNKLISNKPGLKLSCKKNIQIKAKVTQSLS